MPSPVVSADSPNTRTELYRAERNPRCLDVPPMKFLMIDGTGDPNTSSEYRDAISALYSLAYALKFGLKKTGVEFKVSPLEGLWWADDMAEFSAERKGAGTGR